MSTKYVRELLESVDVLNPERAEERIGEALQELRQVEAARAKDAELIQQLVDAQQDVILRWDSPRWKWDTHTASFISALRQAQEAAETAGFKPSDR